MTEANIVVFGIAATLAVAAIASMFKLITLMITFSTEQSEHRHKLRDDMTAIVLQTELRLERRIERLEATSVGLRDARRKAELDGHGDG